MIPLIRLIPAALALCLVPLSSLAAPSARPEEPPPPVAVVSHGKEVNLEDHLVAGKITIFEFYNDFCHGCRITTPKIERLVRQTPEFVLRKVDINRPGVGGEDWGSPVARQHAIEATPHFEIYDEEGRFRSRGKAAYDQVLLWHWYFIEKGKKASDSP